MRDLSCQPDFVAQAPSSALVESNCSQKLQCDRLIQLQVVGAINLTHTSASDQADDTKPVRKKSSRPESAFSTTDRLNWCAARSAKTVRDGNVRLTRGTQVRTGTRGGNLLRSIQEPIRLIFNGQHSLHFFNEKLVIGTRVLNESLTFFRRTLQRRLKNFPHAVEVFRRHRISVEKITHFPMPAPLRKLRALRLRFAPGLHSLRLCAAFNMYSVISVVRVSYQSLTGASVGTFSP